MKIKFSQIIMAFALLILTACGSKKDSGHNAGAGRQPEAMPVAVVKIPTQTVTTFITYPTRIEGIINSDVRPKVSGYITEVLVDEGQKVRKGQLLFKLETAILTQNANAAKADINAAEVQVNQIKPLVEKNIVSKTQLATAQAKLQQAKSNYESIMANIGYANIKSPINGYVGEIRMRTGNLVSPSDPKPLTVVSEINKVYAYFSMNEKDYLDFLEKTKGKTRKEKIENLPDVTLTMANGQEYPYKGLIQTVNSQVNKETGSVSFRAIFDNPKGMLTNGSSGKIRMPKTYKDILVVPQKSTFQQQDLTLVAKVQKKDSGSVVVLQSIDIKDEKGNLYLVGSGIKKGDEIVVDDVAKLRTGTPINPREEPFDSVAKPLPKVFN